MSGSSKKLGFQYFGTDSTPGEAGTGLLVIVHSRGILDPLESTLYWAEVPADSLLYTEGNTIEEIVIKLENILNVKKAKEAEGSISSFNYNIKIELAF